LIGVSVRLHIRCIFVVAQHRILRRNGTLLDDEGVLSYPQPKGAARPVMAFFEALCRLLLECKQAIPKLKPLQRSVYLPSVHRGSDSSVLAERLFMLKIPY
jgi:hypothetical protein